MEGDERTKCIANDDTCKTCSRDGCNKKASFSECLATEGAVSIDIKSTDYKPKSQSENELFFTKICKDYNDACFILTNDSNLVTRDCFHEYLQKTGLYTNYIFENYKSSSYEMCSEPLCNDQDIQEMHCVSCNSQTDKNCVDGTSTGRKRCELEVNPSGCYHFNDGLHVERGCISDLALDRREMCESDSDECKSCIGNECNSKASFQKCIKAVPGINLNISTICRRYVDECYTHIYNNEIRRGCVGDLIDVPIEGVDIENDCKNDAICELCSDTNDCNGREIATEHCLVCSTDDVFCSTNPSTDMSETCPLALKPFGCYLVKDIGLSAKRGCVLQLEEQERQNCQNSTCKTCIGNNCNLKRSFQKCINCNSEVDMNCKEKAYNQQTLANEMLCPNYLGECYTLVQDGHVIRNCTGDEVIPNADTCTENPENCKLCSDRGTCNGEPVKTLTCASCDSSIDASCATNITFSSFETCQLSIQPQTCYHSIDSMGVHKRGKFI